MRWLETYAKRIQSLLDEGTPQSLTYAALEARLAIERVCYERLRIALDYISPADLKKWQPRNVVQAVIEEANSDAATSVVFSIAKTPVGQVPPEDEEFVEVGRQVGFNPAKIGKLWHSLGNFLHVRLPVAKSDSIASYGEPAKIRSKIDEVLVILRDLEKGTLIMSGIGETVHFHCVCGRENKRRTELLKAGQTINCVNPDCVERWTASIENGEFGFERRSVSLNCHACDEVNKLSEASVTTLPRDTRLRVLCRSCKAENFLIWALRHEKKAMPT
jgi:hypothetical protein